jgi:hypothetical protein
MPGKMAGMTRVRSATRPFRIGTALARVRQAVRPLPKAAMFALAELGHRSLFEQLVACILSIAQRTGTVASYPPTSRRCSLCLVWVQSAPTWRSASPAV